MLAPAGRADKSDFNTVNAVTPDGTVYDMVAVFPEYAMLPEIIGTAYCFNNG
uniref:Uncharacterized protein n=1 Tax=viral metagenome TaxID=1070528 RepID=A0A6C0I4E2_9ZZZZ